MWSSRAWLKKKVKIIFFKSFDITIHGKKLMLNIFTLNNRRDQKEIYRFKIYNKVLKKVHHRIKVVSRKGESACFYVVPEYIYGIPRYDTLSCANFMVNKLRRTGFKVVYTYPNFLFIFWGHIPSQYKQKIQQESQARKESSNQSTSSRPDEQSSAQPQYRDINNYQVSQNFFNKLS